jgi:NTP pyrophosphatase (non-canonical NTP hydrolase)
MTGSQTELPTSELDVRSGVRSASDGIEGAGIDGDGGGARLPEQPMRSYAAPESAFVGKATVPGQITATGQTMDGEPLGTSGDGGLAAAARVIAGRLRNRPGSGGLDVQMLCLAEETGEVIQAYRRATGRARRDGDWPTVAAELADVVVVAYVTAQLANIDLDAAIAAKLDEIEARGGI